jgi:hypothetical protein
MAELIRGVNGREYAPEPAFRLYPTNGDTVDYVGGTLGVPAFTVELPPLDRAAGAFMTAEADIASVFAENLPAMLYLVDEAGARFRPTGRPPRPEPPSGPPGGKAPLRRGPD